MSNKEYYYEDMARVLIRVRDEKLEQLAIYMENEDEDSITECEEEVVVLNQAIYHYNRMALGEG